MAKTEQKIKITGRVGSNDGLKHSTRDGGKDYCRFSLVVDEDSGSSTWFKVTAFDALAHTVADEASKGRLVEVVGRVSASAYLNGDGLPAASLNIAALSFKPIGDAKGATDPAPAAQPEPTQPAAAKASAKEPTEAEKAMVKPVLALVKSGDLSLKKAREQIQKMRISDVAKDRAIARAEALAA